MTTSEPDDSGFTLLEVVTVLAIVALAAAVLAGSIRGNRDNTHPREIARAIVNEARAAAQTAVIRGGTTTLYVDFAKRGVFRDGGVLKLAVPTNLPLSMTAADLPVATDKVGKIEFYPDGSNTGGEIIIGDARTNGYAVRVFWLTGEISSRRLQ